MIMSVSPAKVMEAIAQIGPAGAMKAKMDEFSQVEGAEPDRFRERFLVNLGPRMAIYLAPGRSAETTDEAADAGGEGGRVRPVGHAVVASRCLPKPTLVAELRDPEDFGKALDSLMVAVNKELKSRPWRRLPPRRRKRPARPQPVRPVRRDQMRGGRPGRLWRRRVDRASAGPEAQPPKTLPRRVPAHAGAGTAKFYADRSHRFAAETGRDAELHPTIRMEGKHIAFSSTSEAARVAIDIGQEERLEARPRSSKPCPTFRRI